MSMQQLKTKVKEFHREAQLNVHDETFFAVSYSGKDAINITHSPEHSTYYVECVRSDECLMHSTLEDAVDCALEELMTYYLADDGDKS